MFDGKGPLETGPNTQSWDFDLIFAALSDPFRRSLLVLLAEKGTQTAAVLTGPRPKGLGGDVIMNRVVKSLGTLCASGLVVVKANPADRRQRLYSLAPGLVGTKTETTCTLEFGLDLIRFDLPRK